MEATTSPMSEIAIASLSVSNLRERLKALGIAYGHCIEKAELQKLLRRAELMKEKVEFKANDTWQPVKSYHICPKGLQYQMDMATGETNAKLQDPKSSKTSTSRSNKIKTAPTYNKIGDTKLQPTASKAQFKPINYEKRNAGITPRAKSTVPPTFSKSSVPEKPSTPLKTINRSRTANIPDTIRLDGNKNNVQTPIKEKPRRASIGVPGVNPPSKPYNGSDQSKRLSLHNNPSLDIKNSRMSLNPNNDMKDNKLKKDVLQEKNDIIKMLPPDMKKYMEQKNRGARHPDVMDRELDKGFTSLLDPLTFEPEEEDEDEEYRTRRRTFGGTFPDRRQHDHRRNDGKRISERYDPKRHHQPIERIDSDRKGLERLDKRHEKEHIKRYHERVEYDHRHHGSSRVSTTRPNERSGGSSMRNSDRIRAHERAHSVSTTRVTDRASGSTMRPERSSGGMSMRNADPEPRIPERTGSQSMRVSDRARLADRPVSSTIRTNDRIDSVVNSERSHIPSGPSGERGHESSRRRGGHTGRHSEKINGDLISNDRQSQSGNEQSSARSGISRDALALENPRTSGGTSKRHADQVNHSNRQVEMTVSKDQHRRIETSPKHTSNTDGSQLRNEMDCDIRQDPNYRRGSPIPKSKPMERRETYQQFSHNDQLNDQRCNPSSGEKSPYEQFNEKKKPEYSKEYEEHVKARKISEGEGSTRPSISIPSSRDSLPSFERSLSNESQRGIKRDRSIYVSNEVTQEHNNLSKNETSTMGVESQPREIVHRTESAHKRARYMNHQSSSALEEKQRLRREQATQELRKRGLLAVRPESTLSPGCDREMYRSTIKEETLVTSVLSTASPARACRINERYPDKGRNSQTMITATGPLVSEEMGSQRLDEELCMDDYI